MEDFFAGVAEHWPLGREDYHWLVTPDPATVRESLVLPYRDLTHREGLEPVPSHRAHITVQHFAPVSGLSGTEIAHIAGLVRYECAGIPLSPSPPEGPRYGAREWSARCGPRPCCAACPI